MPPTVFDEGGRGVRRFERLGYPTRTHSDREKGPLLLWPGDKPSGALGMCVPSVGLRIFHYLRGMSHIEKYQGAPIVCDVELFKEGDYWIASCPKYDIVAHGANQYEAKRNFKEVVGILVDALLLKSKA